MKFKCKKCGTTEGNHLLTFTFKNDGECQSTYVENDTMYAKYEVEVECTVCGNVEPAEAVYAMMLHKVEAVEC